MYVLLGANGNITSKIARALLSKGAQVCVIGRDAQRLAPLARAGAQLAVGDIADSGFLSGAMRGAQAVYSMLPPCYSAAAPMAQYTRMGEAIAKAIAATGVKRLVNLSSIGAHLPAGTGPIVTLHQQEQRLNQLKDVQVLHLRPGYFFENHLNAIGLIQTYGVYSDMIAAEVPVPSVSTQDIAAVAARELVAPGSSARQEVLHLRAAQLYTPAQAAAVLGRAIGKPDLQYVQADPTQAKAGMVQQGMSPAIADILAEMSGAIAHPAFIAEMLAGRTEVAPMRLEEFAPTFRVAYESAARQARSEYA